MSRHSFVRGVHPGTLQDPPKCFVPVSLDENRIDHPSRFIREGKAVPYPAIGAVAHGEVYLHLVNRDGMSSSWRVQKSTVEWESE